MLKLVTLISLTQCFVSDYYDERKEEESRRQAGQETEEQQDWDGTDSADATASRW